ncbi:MAG: disulfide bond formation protein B [Candidatus Eutrophobiaceae bacterium]
MKSLRWYFLTLLLYGIALLGFAFYLQYGKGLEPCPLCMMQRLIWYLILPCLLLGFILAPRLTGLRLLTGLLFVLAASGAGIAGWQVYLQHLPPDKVPVCGPGFDYIVDNFIWQDAMRIIFQGSGECAEVLWTFLGLSIAGWSMVNFLVIALAAMAAFIWARRFQ